MVTYLRVELVTVGIPDALQFLVSTAAANVSLVVVDLHQVEEEPREGVGISLNEYEFCQVFLIQTNFDFII